jgi:predicted RNase H-like nuclease (RuvC/YqgF family)
MEQHNCIQVGEIAAIKTDIENIKNQVSKFDLVSDAVIELKTIQKENQKRDIDRDEERKEQAKINQKQSETLIKINDSLDLMNKKLDSTNAKVEELEKKYENSENKNLVDLRDLDKEEKVNWFKTNWKPIAGGVGGIGIIGTIIYLLTQFGDLLGQVKTILETTIK